MSITPQFAERVRSILIANDVNGINFRDLNAKVRTPNHPSADLRDLLNAWRQRKWVDLYLVPRPHARTKRMYRATRLLLEQWPIVNTAITDLLLAPGLPLDQGAVPSRTSDQDP